MSTADPGSVNQPLAERAATFAEVALANVTREYPNAPAHLIGSAAELVPPRTYHPAFYGAYDWHSSVHMHWLLVRLLRRYALPQGVREATLTALDAHLAPAPLASEAAYLRDHPSFERPYGWAWLLALTAECRALAPPHAERWSEALAPAAEAVAELVLAWLPKATYPVRHGTHANSAFSLGLLLDSAERAGQGRLVEPVRAKVREWYVPDHGAVTRWEPSGQDFLSPLLAEADAVRRVLPEAEFAAWLGRFLPELEPSREQQGARDQGDALFLAPPRVSDPADPQIGHLFGLCLSRAAALRDLADALPAGDPRALTLLRSAQANLEAALPVTTSGDFTTDHWLATFAALALDGGV